MFCLVNMSLKNWYKVWKKIVIEIEITSVTLPRTQYYKMKGRMKSKKSNERRPLCQSHFLSLVKIFQVLEALTFVKIELCALVKPAKQKSRETLAQFSSFFQRRTFREYVVDSSHEEMNNQWSFSLWKSRLYRREDSLLQSARKSWENIRWDICSVEVVERESFLRVPHFFHVQEIARHQEVLEQEERFHWGTLVEISLMFGWEQLLETVTPFSRDNKTVSRSLTQPKREKHPKNEKKMKWKLRWFWGWQSVCWNCCFK